MTTVLRAPFLSVVMCSLPWCWLMMNLDRWLTSSLDTESRLRMVLLAVPRLALAVVLGLVMIEPMMLLAFRAEIAQELHGVAAPNHRPD